MQKALPRNKTKDNFSTKQKALPKTRLKTIFLQLLDSAENLKNK